ncbi:hypothetical protein D3C87_1704170 [compost metagenome]
MRLAISMGGDADTIAAVAGGIAEVFYPIPYDMQEHVFRRLPQEARELLVEFNARRRTVFPPRTPTAQECNAAVEAIFTKTGRCREVIEAGPITFRSRCRRMFSRIRSIPSMLKAV